jgi:hypothetical protein
MKTSLVLVPLLSLLTFGLPSVRAADPQLETWQTANTRRYARIYESDAARLAGNAVTTWSRGSTSQATPSYAGVIQVSSSSNWVYLRSSGLGTHVMGPWYLNAAHTQNFPSFPANTGVLYRIPRTPIIPANKTLTGLGAIGYFVDGVAVFDNRDAFSYSTANRSDASPVNGLRGDGVWNREAYANEGMTFDPAFAHQAMTNHHYHANAPAVRHALGDHVNFDSVTKLYSESTAPVTRHSPIIGWLADGLPVYGPYGYSSPLDPTSGVRRMTSGYVLRDGAYGTTPLATTGRTSLPAWAARAQGRSATLPASVQGPAVGGDYALGHFIEDYDYLGDLGRTQGVDFDLNECNVRYCVTPEFPNGTYAYFVTIAADGTPKFPNIAGRWYFGDPTGGSVNAISENVTEFVRASQASPIRVTAATDGGTCTLTWESVEGATYKVESSADGVSWATLANGAAVTSSGGESTRFSTTTLANQYRVTCTALATYDTRGAGGLSGVGNTATAPLAVGATGTVEIGGSKISGAAREAGPNITHPNGNVYDQVLMTGDTASMRNDPGQLTRVSYLDLDGDIVQVEMSGAGTLIVRLDGATGPMLPALYNQDVNYMKGNARLTIVGADEGTNLTVFSVGRMTAVNQALFKSDAAYDGFGDLASIAIQSSDGKFGGIRSANAGFRAAAGFTGLFAPGVQFTGPVLINDLTAADDATPILQLGATADVRVTGGNLAQLNARAVRVSGFTSLAFADGTDSHGRTFAAQANRARLEQNGSDVTGQLVR